MTQDDRTDRRMPADPEIGSRLDGPPPDGTGFDVPPENVPWPEEKPMRRFNPWLAVGIVILLYLVVYAFGTFGFAWLLAPLLGGIALVLLVVEIVFGPRHDHTSAAAVVYSLIIGVMLTAVSMLILALAQGKIDLWTAPQAQPEVVIPEETP